MTIRELSAGIRDGKWTSEQLTERCLCAIAADNKAGRHLNAVCEIDPSALFYAQACDEEIRKNGLRSLLHGVPVLIKDNIDVKNLHTTAGSLALADHIAFEDAPAVKKLREAGAVILGKTCLSEFAYFMSTENMPNGFSSLGGQVLNAHDPSYDCSGSSSGSAVAVSANFVPYAIGTETDGSLMSPAAANSIVSIKPTVGLVSRHGIIPISHVQDTAGPMCTCVEDAAAVLSVMAGVDENDPATYTCKTRDYMSALTQDCEGLRIGILINPADELSVSVLDMAKEILQAHHAEVCDIEMEPLELDELQCMIHEFAQGINLYLSAHRCACRTLGDIVAFNRAHADECLKYGQDLLEKSLAAGGRLNEPEYIAERIRLDHQAKTILNQTMKKYQIDVILSAGKRPVGNLAPISGYPCLSLPARSTDDTSYRPLNFHMTALPYREDLLLRTAYTLEKELSTDCRPSWLKEQERTASE